MMSFFMVSLLMVSLLVVSLPMVPVLSWAKAAGVSMRPNVKATAETGRASGWDRRALACAPLTCPAGTRVKSCAPPSDGKGRCDCGPSESSLDQPEVAYKWLSQRVRVSGLLSLIKYRFPGQGTRVSFPETKLPGVSRRRVWGCARPARTAGARHGARPDDGSISDRERAFGTFSVLRCLDRGRVFDERARPFAYTRCR